MGKYVLNESTGTLHIKGYCTHSTRKFDKGVTFKTEQEAYEYAGKHIKLCKLCERKKEAILKNQS